MRGRSACLALCVAVGAIALCVTATSTRRQHIDTALHQHVPSARLSALLKRHAAPKAMVSHAQQDAVTGAPSHQLYQAAQQLSQAADKFTLTAKEAAKQLSVTADELSTMAMAIDKAQGSITMMQMAGTARTHEIGECGVIEYDYNKVTHRHCISGWVCVIKRRRTDLKGSVDEKREGECVSHADREKHCRDNTDLGFIGYESHRFDSHVFEDKRTFYFCLGKEYELEREEREERERRDKRS